MCDGIVFIQGKDIALPLNPFPVSVSYVEETEVENRNSRLHELYTLKYRLSQNCFEE